MRARALLSILLVAAAVAACERHGVTTPEAPDAAPRRNESTDGTSGDATQQGGYLGSGNRTDSTATEPVSPSTTPQP